MKRDSQRHGGQGTTVYGPFFNFHGHPFELVPNPAFLYLSSAHRKALNHLAYGIRQQSGFILLTGEVGTGKTTLIRRLIKSHLSDVTLSKLFNTRVHSIQLLEMILDDFGVSPSGKDKPSLLRDLNDFLIGEYALGHQCVLIIDEAQNLTHELLEEVRLLSNLENDHHKLLRIILVGQPELKQILASPRLLQLRQRIQVSCHIPPLPKGEVGDYIAFRLETAGNREAITLNDEATEAVFRYTQGVPRLINILGDYLLLDAFAHQAREITAATVHEVATDLDFENRYWDPDRPAGPEEDGLNASRAQCNWRNSGQPDDDAPFRASQREQAVFLRQFSGFQKTLRDRLDAMGKSIERLSSDVCALKERVDKQADQALPADAPQPQPGVNGKLSIFLKQLNNRLRTIEEALPRLDRSPGQEVIQSQLTGLQEVLGSRLDVLWQTVEALTEDMHSLKEHIEERPIPERAVSPSLPGPLRQPSRSWLSRLIFRAS